MNLKNFPKRLDSKTSCLRISVPENLDLALEGLIRKVLREQPKTDDIYSFAANYFEKLLEIRDRTGAKFTATQLCPFHNDEDAHEMIKLAGTFPKPPSRGKPTTNVGKPKDPVKNTQGKKEVRRLKAKESSKGKKPVEKSKQATPDLIKKLPTLVESEVKNAEEDKKSEKEENEEEFQTSDPIKELVEKELMMEESRKNKTDGREKTEMGNTQKEEEPECKAIGEESKEEKTKQKQGEEKEEKQAKNEEEESSDAKPEKNEKIAAEISVTKEEEGEVLKEINNKKTEDLEATIKENKKDDEEGSRGEKSGETAVLTDEGVKNTSKKETEDEEMRKGTVEPSKLEQNQEAQVVETHIKKETDKPEKENDNKKPATANETLKQESDSHIDKLSHILGEVMTKDKDELVEDENTVAEQPLDTEKQKSTEPTAEAKVVASKPPGAETKEDSSDQQPETEKDIPETANDGTKALETPKDQSEKPEEVKTVSNTPEPVPQEILGEGTKTDLTESERKEDSEIERSTDQSTEQSNQLPEENEKATEEPRIEGKPSVNDKISLLSEESTEARTEALEEEGKKESEEEKVDQETLKSIKTVENTSDRKSEQEATANEITDEMEKQIPTNSELEKPEEESKTETPNTQLKLTEEKKKIEEEEKLSNKEEENQKEEEKEENKIFQAEADIPAHSQVQEKAVTEIPAVEKAAPNASVQEEISEKPEKMEEEKQDLQKENKMTENEKIQTEKVKTESEGAERPQSKEGNPESEELCGVVDIKNLPEKVETVDEKPLDESTNQKGVEGEELCTVVDIQHLRKKEEAAEEGPEDENVQKGAETEELCTVVDIQHIHKKEEVNNQKSEVESTSKEVEAEEHSNMEPKPETKDTEQSESENKAESDSLLVEVSQISAEDKTDDEKPNESSPTTEELKQKDTETDSTISTKPEHLITIEEAENSEEKTEFPSPPTEIQIKTIQTHYYDSLQVPETVTKEYRVHSIGTPTVASLLGDGDVLHRGYEAVQGLANSAKLSPAVMDENTNAPAELIERSASPPVEAKTSVTPELLDAKLEQEVQKTDSDDLLTPISDYSLNLSELSYQTVQGMFLDSERRYSSLEKEEIRYATPKSTVTPEQTTDNRQEVEEVIEKAVKPSNVEAVPMPPREPEEISEENEIQEQGKAKGEDKQDIKPEKRDVRGEGQASEGSDSSNGRSEESEIPFISVEVKTVIETQLLDDEDEEKDVRHPEVEVKVEARIDIQDDSRIPQTNSETETEIAKDKCEEKSDVKSNSEGFQSINEDDGRKESSSTEATTGKDESTGESDSVSSAATEIKRTESGRRDLGSTRGFSSSQSLDYGKRNPLVKTRSLSSFRHGVTDFEVWNTIEKELEDAATKIQSKFRGYKTRKKLQRENAMQITTEESSSSTTPAEGEPKDECQQSTGEFHDIIVLSEHPR